MKSKLILAALFAFAVIVNGASAEDKAAKPAATKADAKPAAKPEAKAKDAAKPGSDGEVIKADSKAMLEAFKAKKIDEVMAHYSDKFTSAKLATKSDVKALFDMASNSGYLDGVTIEEKDSKITVEGDKATIGPIVMTGSFGTATNVFHLTKENGKWMITGQDLDGVDI